MTSSNSAAANKALVSKVMDAVFVRRDSNVVEQHFDKGYIQHNPKIPNGRDAISALISQLPAGFRYESGMIVAEGDLVMIHGRFSGFGQPTAWIVTDILRVADSVLTEHWDVIQDEATRESSKSGLPMFGEKFGG